MIDMREFVIPAPFARTASERDQAGTHAPYHLPLDAALHDHRISPSNLHGSRMAQRLRELLHCPCQIGIEEARAPANLPAFLLNPLREGRRRLATKLWTSRR
jgi:hypothetical protein